MQPWFGFYKFTQPFPKGVIFVTKKRANEVDSLEKLYMVGIQHCFGDSEIINAYLKTIYKSLQFDIHLVVPQDQLAYSVEEGTLYVFQNFYRTTKNFNVIPSPLSDHYWLLLLALVFVNISSNMVLPLCVDLAIF